MLSLALDKAKENNLMDEKYSDVKARIKKISKKHKKSLDLEKFRIQKRNKCEHESINRESDEISFEPKIVKRMKTENNLTSDKSLSLVKMLQNFSSESSNEFSSIDSSIIKEDLNMVCA